MRSTHRLHSSRVVHIHRLVYELFRRPVLGRAEAYVEVELRARLSERIVVLIVSD